MNRTQLKKKLDAIFSQYIRLRDTDEWGYGSCITCGERKFWKNADCGHFITRAKLSTRFDPQNCALQCKGCNMLGKQYQYGLALDKRYGEGTAKAIYHRSNARGDITHIEYKAMIVKYTALVNELKAERNME